MTFNRHVIFLVCLISQGSSRLNITKVEHFPKHVVMGDDVQLNCDTNISPDEEYYGIRWNRNGTTFARIINNDVNYNKKSGESIPSRKVFQTHGIRVEEDKIGWGDTLILKNVDHKTTGIFSCHVWMETPPFEEVFKETLLVVHDPVSVVETTEPGPPVNLQAKATNDSITISWEKPQPHKYKENLVRGYIVGLGKGIPDEFMYTLNNSNNRNYTFENLEPDSEWVISLRAFNNMGEGRSIYETARTGPPHYQQASLNSTDTHGLPMTRREFNANQNVSANSDTMNIRSLADDVEALKGQNKVAFEQIKALQLAIDELRRNCTCVQNN